MERDGDRREGRRFPIQQSVVYRATIGRKVVEGCGHTVNMSSSGILFAVDHPLPKAVWVTVEISWPMLLDKRKPIKLVTHGKVVRSGDGLVAIRIRDYEFRTVSGPAVLGAVGPPSNEAGGAGAQS